jgi:hypothetical protein
MNACACQLKYESHSGHENAIIAETLRLTPSDEFLRMTVKYDELTVLRATAAIVVKRAECKSFVIRFSERFSLIQRITGRPTKCRTD